MFNGTKSTTKKITFYKTARYKPQINSLRTAQLGNGVCRKQGVTEKQEQKFLLLYTCKNCKSKIIFKNVFLLALTFSPR